MFPHIQCDQKGRVKNRRRVNNFWAYLLELCIFINKFLPRNRQMAPKSPFLVTLLISFRFGLLAFELLLHLFVFRRDERVGKRETVRKPDETHAIPL